MSLNVIGDDKNGHQIITYCLDTETDETLIRPRGTENVHSLHLLQPSSSSRSLTPTSPTTPTSPRPPSSPQPTILSNGSSRKNIFKTAFRSSTKTKNLNKNKHQQLSVENLSIPYNGGLQTQSPQLSQNKQNQPKKSITKHYSLKHVSPSKALRKLNSEPQHFKDNVDSPNPINIKINENNIKSSSEDENHKKYGLFKKLSYKLKRSKKSKKKTTNLSNSFGLVEPSVEVEGLIIFFA